ncbi:MAG: hypothetical protein ACLSAH_15685 [Bilophila wadsworthia]
MNCPHLSAFEAGHMVKLSDKYAVSAWLQGPRSACDSFERKWNNGVNCVNNATCIGCTPDLPRRAVPFYVN